MLYETLNYKVENKVATIEINRPPVNPLNSQFFSELYDLLEDIEFNDEVRTVVITGAGEKAFSAGADIKEMTGIDEKGLAKMSGLSRKAFHRLETLSKPVIAAINGTAFGGGLELALACDLRISSDKAKFALPEVKLGIIPGGGGTQRLPRLIGQARAKQLMMLGDTVLAEEAAEYGIVNKVVPHEELASASIEWAQQIAEYSPVALRMLKTSIDTGGEVDQERGLDIEYSCSYIVFQSEDKQEGMAAFAQKENQTLLVVKEAEE